MQERKSILEEEGILYQYADGTLMMWNAKEKLHFAKSSDSAKDKVAVKLVARWRVKRYHISFCPTCYHSLLSTVKPAWNEDQKQWAKTIMQLPIKK